VILDATRVLRSGLRLGNSARLSQLIVQAHDEAARILLDQIAEPLRIAVRADAVVRGPAGHPSGVDGITVGIAVLAGPRRLPGRFHAGRPDRPGRLTQELTQPGPAGAGARQ